MMMIAYPEAVKDGEVEARDTTRGISEGSKGLEGFHWAVRLICTSAKEKDLIHSYQDCCIRPLILVRAAVVKESFLRPFCILEQGLCLFAVTIGSPKVKGPEISKEWLVELREERQ